MFPELNKSREAGSIEIFVSTNRNLRTCCCTSSLFSDNSTSTWFFHRCKQVEIALCQIWALWQICQNIPTISAIFCVVWWALWSSTLSYWNITSCIGINLADTLLNLRRSRIIFWAEMALGLSLAAFSCVSLGELCWCYELSLLYATRTPVWTSSPTDWRPSHKRAQYSNTRDMSTKFSHPWTRHCSKSVMNCNFSTGDNFCHD